MHGGFDLHLAPEEALERAILDESLVLPWYPSDRSLASESTRRFRDGLGLRWFARSFAMELPIQSGARQSCAVTRRPNQEVPRRYSNQLEVVDLDHSGGLASRPEQGL